VNEPESYEGAILVCVRVKSNDAPVEGSVISACADCDTPVWVSPDGVALSETEKDIRRVCARCSVKYQADETEFRITDATRQRLYGLGWNDEMIETYGKVLTMLFSFGYDADDVLDPSIFPPGCAHNN
jgi:hypothetical protein